MFFWLRVWEILRLRLRMGGFRWQESGFRFRNGGGIVGFDGTADGVPYGLVLN